MFEQEIEMEKKEGSGIGPVVIILLMVCLFVGGIGVVIYQSKQTLTTDQAKAAVEANLKAQPPVSVTFHTGRVSYSNAEKPSDAQYKLFEKAGLIKIGPTNGIIYAAQVDLTPAGKAFMAGFPAVTGKPEKDGSVSYTLPLASRKLVSLDKVTKVSQHRFEVQYTWAWQTTKAGDLFDVAGKVAQSLPSYERSMLIDQHGGAYYHAAPAQAKIMLTKDEDRSKPTY
jgi:hypothetical protein